LTKVMPEAWALAPIAGGTLGRPSRPLALLIPDFALPGMKGAAIERLHEQGADGLNSPRPIIKQLPSWPGFLRARWSWTRASGFSGPGQPQNAREDLSRWRKKRWAHQPNLLARSMRMAQDQHGWLLCAAWAHDDLQHLSDPFFSTR